ncbi:GntP family permease [Trueperella sp. LYQ141]|uniref:GntP family permease n=1 Tax=Trueperella sp. LYQ141 TaxID=3391058 RepID=UPI003983BD7F
MSPGLMIVHLVLAIAIILIGIIVLKLNAAISMVIASVYLGIAVGLPLMETVDAVGKGFGNMMAGIGLPIGFGIILGQLLSDSGGANVIAEKIMAALPERRAIWGVSLAGFILSIPVFFDVTFVILIPIGITIAARINVKMAYVTGLLTIGATTAHCVVPPTPNPLAAAEIFKFDLGIMLGVGLVVGLITVILSNFIYIWIHDKFKIWNEKKDVNHSSNITAELIARREAGLESGTQRPSLLLALVPIIVPIVCILVGTVGKALFDTQPVWSKFLGDKTIAMLLGTLGAYAISAKYIGRNKLEDSAGEGLKSAGVVLLITGAGGAFANVIATAGVGDSILSLLNTGTSSKLAAMFLAFTIGLIFRVAQGSGTVAGMTAMTIMASMAPAIGIHPVWIALACLSGGNSIGHVNDSGFWVATNMSGLTVTGGLKTYTLGSFISAILIFIQALLGAMIIG